MLKHAGHVPGGLHICAEGNLFAIKLAAEMLTALAQVSSIFKVSCCIVVLPL